LYFHADVFVLPGLDLPGDVEGFGIVFSEAALAGVPPSPPGRAAFPMPSRTGKPACWFLRATPRPSSRPCPPCCGMTKSGAEWAGPRRNAPRYLAWEVIVGRYEQAIRDALASGN
jgi:hypothetical protein